MNEILILTKKYTYKKKVDDSTHLKKALVSTSFFISIKSGFFI